MNLRKIINEGCVIKTSGTTGTPKDIIQTPEKLKAAYEIAIASQQLTSKSKVYTICKTTHAGGLLAQTLPAFRIGAEVSIETFNAFSFCREIKKYTHTHITPGHAQLIMRTKGFKDLDLTGIWITCGSDPVEWNIIEAFVNRGATFMANWGMSEIGPCVINKRFEPYELCNSENIIGDKYWCDVEIVNQQLFVQGELCVYSGWFATKDRVYEDQGTLYYKGRIK